MARRSVGIIFDLQNIAQLHFRRLKFCTGFAINRYEPTGWITYARVSPEANHIAVDTPVAVDSTSQSTTPNTAGQRPDLSAWFVSLAECPSLVF
jgi:hypothetical protein